MIYGCMFRLRSRILYTIVLMNMVNRAGSLGGMSALLLYVGCQVGRKKGA
jgi:hypothetical protein